jgi:co-chaperonin GroES (HSP10)
MSNLIPTADRILAKVIRAEESTVSEGGIILSTPTESEPSRLEVVSIGEEVKGFKVKDNLLVGEYSGEAVKYKGKLYVAIHPSEVLAIVRG